jgi:hypothetical protein
MVWTRKRLAATGRPHGTGTQTVNPGKAKLIAEAYKKVGDNRTNIVNALYDSLIKGNASSAKLLFALADGLINCEDPVVMSQLVSYAERLTAEQQVTAEMAEAVVKEKEKVEQQVSELAPASRD